MNMEKFDGNAETLKAKREEIEKQIREGELLSTAAIKVYRNKDGELKSILDSENIAKKRSTNILTQELSVALAKTAANVVEFWQELDRIMTAIEKNDKLADMVFGHKKEDCEKCPDREACQKAKDQLSRLLASRKNPSQN